MTATAPSTKPARMPRLLGGDRTGMLVRLVLNGMGQAAAAVITALLVSYAFDRLLLGTPTPLARLAPLAAGLVVATLLSSWLRARERLDAERLGQGYVHKVRLTLFDKLAASAPRALQQRSQGGQVMRFVGDLTALRQWLSLGLARLVVAGTMTVGTLGALLVVDSALALQVGSAVVIGGALLIVQGHGLRGAVVESRKRRGRLASNVNEKIASVAVMQAFGQSGRERERVASQSRRLRRAMVEKARYAGRLRAVAEGTGGAAVAVVLLVGAAQGATPGSVAAAMTILGLLVPQLRDLGRVEEYRHGAGVARRKILEVLNRPVGVRDRKGATPLVPGPGRLEFDGVVVDGALGEPGRGFRAVVEPGQVVAVVGPNGAGKSTLLALAARMIEPDEGRVLLDGQDLAEHTLVSTRRALGLVGPDLPLLRGTVDKNLRYRWHDAPPEELLRVRRLCDVDDLLDELPEGADTRVAEGGAGLSAGQRQRVALARALVGDPPVLLLDEADANLDAEAAATVDRVVSAHVGSVLLVTHAAERLSAADVLWHVEDGRMVEAGPPARLLAADGPTARMFSGLDAVS